MSDIQELECCTKCDEPTGHAGRYDDSLYIGATDYGPYCEDCWESLPEEQLEAIEAKDKEIESLKAEVERLTHFSHFMCETWSSIQQWSIEHFDENNLGSFPMVQGTANQNRLRDIGEKPYKKELINQAVMELIK